MGEHDLMFWPSHMTLDKKNDSYAVLILKSNVMDTTFFTTYWGDKFLLISYEHITDTIVSLTLTTYHLNSCEKLVYVDLLYP